VRDWLAAPPVWAEVVRLARWLERTGAVAGAAWRKEQKRLTAA
jgi:hypothetical protein